MFFVGFDEGFSLSGCDKGVMVWSHPRLQEATSLVKLGEILREIVGSALGPREFEAL